MPYPSRIELNARYLDMGKIKSSGVITSAKNRDLLGHASPRPFTRFCDLYSHAVSKTKYADRLGELPQPSNEASPQALRIR